MKSLALILNLIDIEQIEAILGSLKQLHNYMSNPKSIKIDPLNYMALLLIEFSNPINDKIPTEHEISQIENELQAVLMQRVFNSLLNDSGYSLTEMELQTLILDAQGFGTKKIADTLQRTIKTINRYYNNIKHKTGCNSISEVQSKFSRMCLHLTIDDLNEIKRSFLELV